MNDHNELDEIVASYVEEGCWCGFGIEASVKPYPISVLEGKLFFLYEPQQWVRTCWMQGEDALDLLCETKC